MAAGSMNLILIGGLAIGGFLLVQSGMLNNIFPHTAATAPPPVAPVSGATSSTTATTPCMGIDAIGNPCACPPAASAVAYAYPSQTIGCYRNKGVLVCPGVGTQVPGEGFFPATTDCVSCKQTYGGDCRDCVGPFARTTTCQNCLRVCGDASGRVCGSSRRDSSGRIIGVIPGSVNFIPGSSVLGSSTLAGSSGCDCSRCGAPLPQSTSPSSVGDLNNFIGGSIAQAGYGFR